MSTKVGVVSLGCDKNRVDTEVMLENLAEGGYEITADPSEADVIIVNTCAFLQSSRQESIDTVLEMAHFKQNGKCKKVIITGCLGQKFGQEVFDGLTEADAVAGVNSYGRPCRQTQALHGMQQRHYIWQAHTYNCAARGVFEDCRRLRQLLHLLPDTLH